MPLLFWPTIGAAICGAMPDVKHDPGQGMNRGECSLKLSDLIRRSTAFPSSNLGNGDGEAR